MLKAGVKSRASWGWGEVYERRQGKDAETEALLPAAALATHVALCDLCCAPCLGVSAAAW